MHTFQQLKKILKTPVTNQPVVDVAILGDTATQLLGTAIRGEGRFRGFDINLWEADFSQVELQVLDPSSELHQRNVEFIVIFQSTHKLMEQHALLPVEQQTQLAARRIDFIHQLCSDPAFANRKIVCCNYPEIDDTVFGNYANKVEASFIYQVRLLNVGLMQLAQQFPSLFICDLAAVQNKIGRNALFAPNIYTSTEMVISVDALPMVAARLMDIILAVKGQFKKCLILDLDNTLWGGVIGDDGIEGIQLGHGLGIGKAFTEFQQWVKKLRQRGIIICVASKNEEQVAKEPFLQHPDMVLRLDDIAVFQANWETKVDNIRTIQRILNIGFDAMVFIDDNPFERNIVRDNIPEITVPEMPEDPAEYLEYLYSLNLFETTSYSDSDNDRTRQYQLEAQRVAFHKTFNKEADFLQSLDMKAKVSEFTPFNIPRVAQLTQRSNQFNLRTQRYTEADLADFANKHEYVKLALSLSDKFGDHGLVAVVILRPFDADTLFIDTWLMSCRVLSRGMEQFTLNAIAEEVKQRGYLNIIGEYIPTPKNHMVEQLLPSLGFSPIEGKDHQYILNLNHFNPIQTFIQL